VPDYFSPSVPHLTIELDENIFAASSASFSTTPRRSAMLFKQVASALLTRSDHDGAHARQSL